VYFQINVKKKKEITSADTPCRAEGALGWSWRAGSRTTCLLVGALCSTRFSTFSSSFPKRDPKNDLHISKNSPHHMARVFDAIMSCRTLKYNTRLLKSYLQRNVRTKSSVFRRARWISNVINNTVLFSVIYFSFSSYTSFAFVRVSLSVWPAQHYCTRFRTKRAFLFISIITKYVLLIYRGDASNTASRNVRQCANRNRFVVKRSSRARRSLHLQRTKRL